MKKWFSFNKVFVLIFLIRIVVGGFMVVNAQNYKDSFCQLFKMPFVKDCYTYDGFNPEMFDGKVFFNDTDGMISSRQICRWLVQYDERNILNSKYLNFQNLKEVFIINERDKVYRFNYVNKLEIKVITMFFETSLKNRFQGDEVTNSPSILNAKSNGFYYLTLNNYNLNLESLIMFKELRYLNLLNNEGIDFLPLNIGLLPKLKILIVDSIFINTPELQLIKLMNPQLTASCLKMERTKNVDTILKWHSQNLMTHCNIPIIQNKCLLRGDIVLKDSNDKVLLSCHFDRKGRLHGLVQVIDTGNHAIQSRFYKHSKPIGTWSKSDIRNNTTCKIEMGNIERYKYFFYDSFTNQINIKLEFSVKR